MSIFTLAISCLTISNLPWFMVPTLQVPICNIVFCSIGLYFHHKSHPQLSAIFLWLHLFILSGVIYPLFSSSLLGPYQPGELISDVLLYEYVMKWISHSVVSDSLWPCGLYSPWNSLGQNTEVGSLSISRGSSQPRDQTQVSCMAGRFFTSWATREAPQSN